jgi:hypothetical protein
VAAWDMDNDVFSIVFPNILKLKPDSSESSDHQMGPIGKCLRAANLTI